VLRTRPGFVPPQICLPSTLLGYGAYLYVDPRFCLRLPSGGHYCYHPCLRLPFASVRLGLDFARYLCHHTGHHHIAAGPSPAHIGIGTLITERPSHTTVRTGPYTAVRLIEAGFRSMGKQVPVM